MSSIGKIQVDLVANTAKFSSDMKKAAADTASWASRVGSLARTGLGGMRTALGAVTGAIFNMRTALVGAAAAFGAFKAASALNAAAATVDQIGKMSSRLGISIEQLSVLRFAAKEAGIGFEEMAAFVGKASKNLGELVLQGKKRVDVGGGLISLLDNQGKMRSIVDLLPELARGIQSLGSASERLAAAEKVFGRAGGAQFVQLLEEAGDFTANWVAQAERAKRLGVIFTSEQFRAMAAYRDAVERIGEAWLGLRVVVMTKIAPWLTAAANATAAFVASIPDLVSSVATTLNAAAVDARIAAALKSVGNRIVDVFATIGYGGGLVFMAGIVDAFRFGTGALYSALKGLGRNIAAWLAEGIADGLGALGAPGLAGTFAAPLIGVVQGLEEALRGVAVAIRAVTPSAEQTFAGLLEAMRSGPGASAFAWAHAIEEVGRAIGLAADEADALLRISEILKSRSMDLPASLVGALERAAKGSADKIRTLAGDMKDAIEGFAKGTADAFVDMLMDGKATFDALLKSWAKMLMSMVVQATILQPIFKALGSWVGTAMGKTEVGQIRTGPPAEPTALGNAFSGGRKLAFAAGGIVTRPTVFPMARGIGLMGEAGPEAIMPLRRIGGKLGVHAGGAGVVVQVIDQRRGGLRPEVSESRGADGRRTISVLIRDEVRGMIGDGSLDRAAGAAWGLQRKGVAR